MSVTSRITQEQVTWFAHTFDQLVGNRTFAGGLGKVVFNTPFP